MTEMVQLEPAATLEPQVLVWVKSLALAPETVMLVTPRAALPVLVTVTDWAELVVPTERLPKARLEGETLAVAEVPVPERLMVWGLPVALSAMLRAALRAPTAAGVKLTLIVQVEPAATLDPQLFV